MATRRSLGTLLAYAAVLLAPLDAAAQDASRDADLETLAAPETTRAGEAQQLFDDGLKDMLAGRYTRGCALIAESQATDPKPGTVFTLAECYARAGKIASADKNYALYLSLFELMPTARNRAHRERAAIARRERNKLGPDLPRLEITRTGSALAAEKITLDGSPVETRQLGKSQSVDPGEHWLEVTDRDGHTQRRRILIARRQTLRVAVPSGPTNHSAPPPPPAADSGSSQRTWAYVAGSIGLTGLAVGSIAGGLTLARKNQIDDHCRDVSSNRAECDDQGLSAWNSAKTLGAISTVGFAIGAAGIGTAITLFLTEPKRAVSGSPRNGWRISMSGSGSAGQFTLGRNF